MYNLNDIPIADDETLESFPKGIVAGKYYVFQGHLDQSVTPPTLRAKVIMSENKELFLKHLDYKISLKFKKSKIFTGVAFSLLTVHASMKYLRSSQKRREQFQSEM